MTKWSPTIAAREVHASVTENWGADEITASVELQLPWANRHALVFDLIGNAREWPHGSFTAKPRAVSAVISPFSAFYTTDGDEELMTYEDAFVTVNYSSAQGEDLLAESLEPTAEFFPLDHKRFRWSAVDGDPLAENEAPGKLIRGLNIVRTFFKVAALSTDLLDLVGTVNDGALVTPLLGLTFAAETLLYTPPNLSRTIKTDGTGFAWNVTMKHNYKPQTWNKFWRSKTEAWEEIVDYETGAVYKNYPPEDHSGIFSL
jgi:hypothetical protein